VTSHPTPPTPGEEQPKLPDIPPIAGRRDLTEGMSSQAPVPADAGNATTTDPVILTIGDIGVTRRWVVTPNGTAPLRGSQWIANDQSVTSTRIPPWAIILAIVFALACLLGLLFLLVKEQVTSGYVQVTVRSGDLLHSTQIPISQPSQVQNVRQLVAEAQSMAATRP